MSNPDQNSTSYTIEGREVNISSKKALRDTNANIGCQPIPNEHGCRQLLASELGDNKNVPTKRKISLKPYKSKL